MKRFLHFLLLTPLALTVHSQVVLNCEMQSNFPEALASGLLIPEGWSTYGVDAAPTGSFADLFPSYAPASAFRVLEKGNITAAFTPSEFAGDVSNDQWLITPEFDVTEDVMQITYTVVACGNSINNNYSIYISESGEDREEFYEIIGSSIKGEGDKMVTSTRRFVLDGYLGEKVRLAFISKGNKTGIMGFGDISVAPYYLALEEAEAAKSIIIDSVHDDISFKVTLCTPMAAKGITAVLNTTAGYESTFSYSHPISAGKETTVVINYPKIEMNGETSCEYKLSLTPDYEDAPTTEITGIINYGIRDYQGVAIMEELTGTWCGYCVYGFGIMDYLQDNYNGTGDGLALGFGVHSGSGSTSDPMQVNDVLDPTRELAKKLNYPGYPYMIINRAVGSHPLYALNMCKDIMAEKSYAKVEISKVNFDAATSSVKVDFNSYLSFSANNPSINALVYVTQNKMSGTGVGWLQMNYLNNMTKDDIINDMGEELVPYFEPYIDRPQDVLIMEFPDVARAIFPSFEGERVVGDWIANMPKEGSIEFVMPTTVTDWENSMISVILTNASTGEIIAGDRIGASDYNKELLSINTVKHDSEVVVHSYNDGNIEIIAPTAGKVEVYSVEGRRIMSSFIQEGSNLLHVGEHHGMYVVRVLTGNISQSIKIML